MAMTRRGRLVTSVTVVAVVGGVVFGVSALAGHAKPTTGPSAGGSPSSSPSPTPPPVCPLTGVTLTHGAVPNRPALAVKVENLPEARPQTGLDSADIVYEEPVEGGITRFIVVYQCSNAARIEPIRSARLTDPDILDQFGTPIFGYAGGVAKVEAKVHQRGLIDVNYEKAASAYHRDGSRSAPHNLYSSTQALYAAAHTHGAPPAPVFTYSARPPAGALLARTVHLPFSGSSDVYWKWSVKKKAWLRSHGTVPHTLSDGMQVQATNVVVQVVKTVLTDITDANGMPSPEVIATGSGKAYVFRNGKVIVGTWSRPSLSDLTVFRDASGNQIPLAPGTTWVELLPNTIPVTYS
jgi:DUF3048 family protein